MKKATTAAVALLAGAFLVRSQGTVSMGNYGELWPYIYVSLGSIRLGGSSAVTTGNFVEDTGNGNDWTVQLYGAITTPGVIASSLSPLKNEDGNPAIANLESGWGDEVPGTWYSYDYAVIPGGSNGSTATVQLYAWYNDGGRYSSYGAAEAVGVPTGISTRVNVITGGAGPPFDVPTPLPNGMGVILGSYGFGQQMHVACSADGKQIVAVFENGGILNSFDGGQTWTTGNAPTGYWLGVASSADGAKLAAAIDGGGIYSSADHGDTWNLNNVPAQAWTALASSEDGTKLVAVAASGAVYTSTNSGSAWTPKDLPKLSWSSVAASADGSKVAIAASSSQVAGGIYTSVDSGNTWISNSFPADTTTSFEPVIAASADGSRLAVATLDVGIYISTNFGINWSETGAGNTWWEGVGLSADGGRITAITVVAFYASTNLGATWTPVTSLAGGDYFQFASSADGNVLIGANWFDDNIDVFRLSPSPVLKIAPSSNNAVLSWIVPSVSVVLQQSADLNTTNWTEVGSALTLTNLQYQTTVSTATNQMFFRLAPK